MKKFSLFLTLLLSCGILLAQDAKEIIERAEDKLRGASSFSELKMTVVRPDWSREVTMKSWAVGRDY